MEEENKIEETKEVQSDDINKGSNNFTFIVAASLLVILAVSGYYLLVRKAKTSALDQTTGGTELKVPANPESGVEESVVEDGSGVREMTVEASEYSFKPDSLTVSKGEKIKLTFKNTGSLPHNFVIDELDVTTKTVSKGSSDTVEFTAQESGTFRFFCSIGNHRSLGMEGELDVE